MKRTLALVLAAALLALVPLCALAESDPPLSTDGWGYIGYIYGGVALAVPPDYESYDYHECPYCKAGKKVDALVNSFGYSSL